MEPGVQRIAFRALLALMAAGVTPAQDASVLPGLAATYGDRKHSVRLIAATPNFYLERGESLHPSLAAAFRAEWNGLLSILQTDDYTFECASAELYIDGARVTAKPLRLNSGRHPILIRYRRQPGVAALRLQWKSAHFPLEPVPSSLLSHPAAKTILRDETLVERGRDLVEEFGCVNCHTAASDSLSGRPGPELSGIGSRINSRWTSKWLESPWEFRAGAVMPALSGEQQRRDVASYLLSLQAADPVKPVRKPGRHDVAQGNQLFGAVGCAACHHEEGLWLDGMGSKTTIGPLAAYLKDPAKLDPGGRMPSLLLTDQQAFQLAAYLLDSNNAAFEQPLAPGDPVRGKEIVQSQGCLACHALSDREPLANRQRAPKLAQLAPERGCLAGEPGGAVPRYRLAADQREAIQAFLRSFRQHPDVSRAPVYQLQRSVRQLRCTACHQADHFGPRVRLAEAAPPLTDVGAKLRGSWLEQVLLNRQRVWNSLDLRMPHYDPRHVRPMMDALARASGVEPGEGLPSPPATDAQRTSGPGMIGADGARGGLACISCHDWGEHKSLGEEGPQLINAARRLRYDWFHRWMLNPARILSGTSMPNYFSSVAANRAGDIIGALWAALSMGERMPLPDGLRDIEAGDSEAKPVPERGAIVVRWDMPEATPAAIAVGLPGGLSYCFDAGESRLRYAWKGGFIDLTGTLLRKTEGNRLTPTAKLIGEIFYRSEEFPLRLGELDRIPQRRFRGYRIVDGYPQFHYQVDGIDVYERVTPAPEQAGIRLEFTIGRVEGPMWFLDGRKIEIPRGANVRFDVAIAAEGTNP